MLAKYIASRNPSKRASRRIIKCWILEAEKSKAIVIYKNPKYPKTKVATLPRYFAPYDCSELLVDTQKEEKFVQDYLWDNKGSCVDRKIINRFLEEKFSSMASAKLRNQVFVNATAKQLFFVAKNPYGQKVGLSLVDAKAALEMPGSNLPITKIQAEFTEQSNCSNISSSNGDDSDSD